jgi:hypothetical protein
MTVSTSDKSDPARINFRMLRTDSLEKKPDSFCAPSGFGRSCAEIALLTSFHRLGKTSVLNLGLPSGTTGE